MRNHFVNTDTTATIILMLALLALTIVALFSGRPAQAGQDAQAQSSRPQTQVETIVVTATRLTR
jgi:Flp pilus assembly protein CpaB